MHFVANFIGYTLGLVARGTDLLTVYLWFWLTSTNVFRGLSALQGSRSFVGRLAISFANTLDSGLNIRFQLALLQAAMGQRSDLWRVAQQHRGLGSRMPKVFHVELLDVHLRCARYSKNLQGNLPATV